jgi:hypothetical protein
MNLAKTIYVPLFETPKFQSSAVQKETEFLTNHRIIGDMYMKTDPNYLHMCMITFNPFWQNATSRLSIKKSTWSGCLGRFENETS